MYKYLCVLLAISSVKKSHKKKQKVLTIGNVESAEKMIDAVFEVPYSDLIKDIAKKETKYPPATTSWQKLINLKGIKAIFAESFDEEH